MAAVQLGVNAALRQQLGMGTTLDDGTAIHDQDQVSVFDGGQAMGNNERGAAFHDLVQRGLDIKL